MKTIKYLVTLAALAVGAQWLSGCSAGYVATAPPPRVNEIIVMAPSSRHVWVPGYYDYSGGNYIYLPGTYQIPPRGRTSYTPGQWQQTQRGGYRRVQGHWNR